MTGVEVKEKLKRSGFTQSEIAEMMGVSPQTFNAYLKVDDIKTGLLENIANAIGKGISYFFEDTNSTNQNTKGNSNVVVGRDNNGHILLDKCQDDLEAALREIQYLKALIKEKDERLDEKERLINVLMNK